jgi:hypothetical protein
MPEKLTDEEYQDKFRCPAMLSAVDLASSKAERILTYLNKHSRLTWELSRIGTSSSLYHGWGAVMHFQACEGTNCSNRQWWMIEVYVNMDEDKVTICDKTPGYASRSRHITHLNWTREILNDPEKLLSVVSHAAPQKRRSY